MLQTRDGATITPQGSSRVTDWRVHAAVHCCQPHVLPSNQIIGRLLPSRLCCPVLLHYREKHHSRYRSSQHRHKRGRSSPKKKTRPWRESQSSLPHHCCLAPPSRNTSLTYCEASCEYERCLVSSETQEGGQVIPSRLDSEERVLAKPTVYCRERALGPLGVGQPTGDGNTV